MSENDGRDQSSCRYLVWKSEDLLAHDWEKVINPTPQAKTPGIEYDAKGKISKVYCMDCKTEDRTQIDFMLREDLWQQIMAQYVHDRGIMCLSCVARRLGRDLCPEDFPMIAVNVLYFSHIQAHFKKKTILWNWK